MRLPVLAPLRHRPFRMLFLGQVVSDLGDWLDFLALQALAAYTWNLGADALAALAVAMMLPWAVFGPVAGVWADRLPRRAVMVTCDLLRAALVIGLVWAPHIYALLGLVVWRGAVSAFFAPARQGAIRALVPEDMLIAANSLSRLSLQTTKILAPLAGGVIVAAAGPRVAFIVDAASFLVGYVLSRPILSLAIGGLPLIPDAGGNAAGTHGPGLQHCRDRSERDPPCGTACRCRSGRLDRGARSIHRRRPGVRYAWRGNRGL